MKKLQVEIEIDSLNIETESKIFFLETSSVIPKGIPLEKWKMQQ